jgi:hypothetical protein
LISLIENELLLSQEPPMFHFTTRELVLVTIIVAMGVAWAGDHFSSAIRRAELTTCFWRAKEKLAELGYDAEFDANHFDLVIRPQKASPAEN